MPRIDSSIQGLPEVLFLFWDLLAQQTLINPSGQPDLSLA